MEDSPATCPLCRTAGGSRLFHRDTVRTYYRCTLCHLTHIPPSQRLSAEAEREEYDKHQNSPDDVRYREFLGRLFGPVNERLRPESNGLDFGSGPGPTLSLLFEEAGHGISLYDPFYAPDIQSLQLRYDFITASEVVEHLHDPAAALALLWSLLLPGGWLGIMTKLALDEAAFSTWHYKNDPTHVCFFSAATMRWLAGKWRTELVSSGDDVFLFRKPE